MCADRPSTSAMPENDQLKKNQPEQPENAKKSTRPQRNSCERQLARSKYPPVTDKPS